MINLWAFESNLHKARKKAGLSQVKLAAMANIAPRRLSEIENRQAFIKLKEIEQIAEILNADVEYIKEGLSVKPCHQSYR